jgi:hypothetical protein
VELDEVSNECCPFFLSAEEAYDFGTIPREKEVRTNRKVGLTMALEPASAIWRGSLEEDVTNLEISQLQIIVRLK